MSSRSPEGVGVLWVKCDHTTPAARLQGHKIVCRKKEWWTVCVYMGKCGTYTGAYIGKKKWRWTKTLTEKHWDTDHLRFSLSSLCFSELSKFSTTCICYYSNLNFFILASKSSHLKSVEFFRFRGTFVTLAHHVILMLIHEEKQCHCLCFIDGRTEEQRKEMTSLRSHSWWDQSLIAKDRLLPWWVCLGALNPEPSNLSQDLL